MSGFFNMTGLSERLRKLRNNHRPKLSQQALSERLGINRATYARYETGDNEPDYDTLEKKNSSVLQCEYRFLNNRERI
ncbi:hypothetical protein BsIDN1_46170 [Bacillus safensis]|uniref:HTH cro/C1-type domain-containing protein n=1 Tax=Bacillus safensis TaxID=561879 RepID=A0A5S9MGQ6_BACIA|nr:hypothetical protein BsIDN1_46170 [Bacillus safensis]